MSVSLYSADLTSSIIIISFAAGPLLLVNIISTVLVLKTMDFTGRACARTICIILHVLQVGLLWRCLKLLLLFDEKDWREFLSLRLIHTALQSIPIAVLKGSHYFSGTDTSTEAIILVVISVTGNAIVFSMYNTKRFLFETDEFSEFSVRVRKPFGVIILTFGTIFLMFSRCGSIMLFFASLPLWLPLPLGIHFIIYLLSSIVHLFRKTGGSVVDFLKIIPISYFNIFELFSQENQKIQCSNVLLYSGILLQNVMMTGVWMMDNNWDYKYELGTIVSIILTFVCGMFLKCCSCSYLQNDKFEPFSDATFQLALKITKNQSPEILGTTNETQNEIKNHEKYHESDNHRSVISLENGYIHKTPQTTHKNISGGNTVERSRKEEYSNTKDSTPNRRKARKASFSNADLASSNSRNTNTLNISDPNNVFNDLHQNEILQNAHTMPCLATRQHPGLTVRSSSRKSTSVEAKQSFSKSPPKNRKNPLPLFPNECSNFVSNKTFDTKHVLSNSVDEYNGSDTDSTYSDYTYSYYDTTDWSTMSCDSNSALTWPPSNPMTFINLHNLPKETTSASDSVQFWLSQLKDWEASLEDSFHSFDKCSSPAPSSEHADKVSSKYSNFARENQMSENVRTKKESDILLRPKDALLQFRNSENYSYLPYNKSDVDNNRHLSGDSTIVIWHDKETNPNSAIQESMV